MNYCCWRSEATRSLATLRRGSTNFDIFLAFLRMELKSGGLTLEDIGTSEIEIDELRVLGCKRAAAEWLRMLRCGGVSHKDCVLWLRMELESGKLCLHDIGTSEDELLMLKIVA